MWIKTTMGLTNLDQVKHIGLAGEGTGDVVVLYLKHDSFSNNVKIECPSSEHAYQTMKRIEKMLQEREELFDSKPVPARTEE